MKRRILATGVVLWLLLMTVAAIFMARRASLGSLRDLWAVRPEFPDVVERIDLELDLREPPRFAGQARLALREGTHGRIRFLLNRKLDVERASDETGRVLRCTDEGRLRSDYHKEARVIAVDLVGPTRELVLDYAGRGFDGSKGADWMGVLLLARDELRMSPQTVFYPEIPSEIDGPGVVPWPARVRLLATPDLEAFAPGSPCEWPDAPPGSRAWCWQSDAPSVLSLVAARRVRRETELGGARVITLLSAEHARLGEAIAIEVEKMLRLYASLWGPIGPRTLGIVEMKSRAKSYNWTSQGIIAMESGALSGEVPIDTLAHETAHLWWGQEVCAAGRGERFLTEGLAEYASWRFLQSTAGEAAAAAQYTEAEGRWWKTVHKTGVDPALLDVRFASKGYTDLAYAKGPVALWRLQRRLGVERMDAMLASYRRRMRDASGETSAADVFLAALREVSAEEAVEIALLEQEGHVHVGLRDVEFEGARIRGRIVAEECPEGIPAPSLARVNLGVHTETGSTRHEVAWTDPGGAAFEVVAPGVVVALVVDPDGELPGLGSSSVLRPDAGLLSSEPADGARELALGPMVVRLRFGVPLAEPAPEFATLVQKSCTANAIEKKTAIFSVPAVSLEDGGRTLAIAIDETSPGTVHELVLPDGLLTARGIPLPPARLRFTVKEAGGLPPPRIVVTEPADGARDVPASLARLKIVFSEPMRRGRGFKTGLVDELKGKGWSFPRLGESRWEDSRTLIWELDGPLERGRRYGLPFGELYRSQMGVRMKRFDLLFETER